MGTGDPATQFPDLITRLSGGDMAYLHLIEAYEAGVGNVERRPAPSSMIALACNVWKGPLLVAGGFTARGGAAPSRRQAPGRCHSSHVRAAVHSDARLTVLDS
ncbi:hypothetical protein GGR51DRAFT_562320 [Nemania sp. FL0031]|nr:hypothetical protein GGR51DRAFT_562320 [Nemania sp. FL0031]